MTHDIVVIGAGQAGLQTAEALRAGGFTGAITLLGDEAHGPYHRPPLSKAWLAGEMDAAQLAMRAPQALARKNITLRLGAPVAAIDRAARQVRMADGSTVPYGALVLATGSTARTLPLPGSGAPGVLSLRSLDDANAIAQHLSHCRDARLPVVVIGGGFVGLEVAATARKTGLEVAVLEAAPRLLGRALSPALADWYAALHRAQGVRLVLGARISSIEIGADGSVTSVRMADGGVHPAGLVVVGVGATANDALAAAAGLECDRGIVVDACGRTSDPLIVAAGDCTARRLADGTLVRLESVHNATGQGKSAAASLLGLERPFTATPWFWSDQHDCKLQIAGMAAGADACVVRGEVSSPVPGVTTPGFSLYHFSAGKLVAVESVNAPKDHLLARKLLDSGKTPTAAQARDATCDLATLSS